MVGAIGCGAVQETPLDTHEEGRRLGAEAHNIGGAARGLDAGSCTHFGGRPAVPLLKWGVMGGCSDPATRYLPQRSDDTSPYETLSVRVMAASSAAAKRVEATKGPPRDEYMKTTTAKMGRVPML